MLYNIEQDLAKHMATELNELLYDMIVLNKLKCPANGEKYRAQPDWNAVEQCYNISSTQFKDLKTKMINHEDVPADKSLVIMKIIKNRFRCDNSRPTPAPITPEKIDDKKLEECYGRSRNQLDAIYDKMNSSEEVPKEDEDILNEIRMNNFQCPPYWKEVNRYNTIYWEKVDDARFKECFEMTKDDFKLSWDTTGDFVFSGRCDVDGERYDLPRVPFMGLLKNTLQNQNQYSDDLTDMLPLLLKRRENLSKRKSSGRWGFLSKRMDLLKRMLEELDE